MKCQTFIEHKNAWNQAIHFASFYEKCQTVKSKTVHEIDIEKNNDK